MSDPAKELLNEMPPEQRDLHGWIVEMANQNDPNYPLLVIGFVMGYAVRCPGASVWEALREAKKQVPLPPKQ